MLSYNPVYALLVFLVFVVIAYLLFRPTKGFFWVIKKSYKVDEKTVIEDILKKIYHSENVNNNVSINFLVNSLGYSDEKIVESIDKMIDYKLVYFEEEYVKLTSEGRNYALRIVRVHRLWERYLADKTGFDKSEWHSIAEEKEHGIDDVQAQELASKLGNPIFDPHGDPIPTPSGKIADIEGILLTNMEKGTIGKIINIDDNPEIIYKQILAENIHIGSQLRLVEKNSKRIVFYSEGEEFILAPIVAGNIKVFPIVDKKEIQDEDIVRLSSLKQGEMATVIGLSKESRGDSRRRLLDLGFVTGAKVSIDLINPFGDPTAYLIKGATIALRANQALKILIKKD